MSHCFARTTTGTKIKFGDPNPVQEAVQPRHPGSEFGQNAGLSSLQLAAQLASVFARQRGVHSLENLPTSSRSVLPRCCFVIASLISLYAT